MGLFGMGETDKKSDENEKQGVWGAQLDMARAEARKGSVGRKKKVASDTTDDGDARDRGGISAKDAEQVRKMFDPEAWRAIVRAPFALGKAVTGRSLWDLEKREEDTLATSTSGVAEYFLQTDPKWIAFTLFAFNWTVIVSDKLIQNAREREKEDTLLPKNPHVAPGVHVVKP